MPRYSARETPEARRTRLEGHASETDPSVVLKAAARYLESRSHSVAEVRRHLAAARYPDALVEQAIARLLDLHLLDDAHFARSWVDSRDRARPRGSQALRRELSLKGIDREVIEEILAARRDADADPGPDSHSDGSWQSRPIDAPEPGSPDRRAAQRLLGKHAAAFARVPDPRLRRQRAYGLLARNGFDPEICREASASLGDSDD